MATFNGGRMVALFLCMLFAPNVSFAQEETWETVAFYMVDPIDEQLAPEVLEYIDKWKDPLTWVTFERDFTPARKWQIDQVTQDNLDRIEAAKAFLREDLRNRGDGTSSWYPSWIPLGAAKDVEDPAKARKDSLFKNILFLEGRTYDTGARIGQAQTLREFFELDGDEPFGLTASGTQNFRSCDERKRRCRKEFYEHFRNLVEIHDASLALSPSRIISFTIKVKSSRIRTPDEGGGFVDELDEQARAEPGIETEYADFNWDSVQLLQRAAMDPDPYVIDSAPYWQPAAKTVSSTETSSWGRIKATFAD